tara:strand:+ start:975 stop:1310 length:336 start_codon:yes stop_codon:yes gene_type:complete
METEIRIDEPDASEKRWCLVVVDTDDATHEFFEKLGLQGGGYTWEGLANQLIELKAPHLKGKLDINAEAEEMYAYAPSPGELDELSKLLLSLTTDHQILKSIVDQAGDAIE